MYGFLDGPHGVFAGNFVVITDEIMDGFRNTGEPLRGCNTAVPVLGFFFLFVQGKQHTWGRGPRICGQNHIAFAGFGPHRPGRAHPPMPTWRAKGRPKRWTTVVQSKGPNGVDAMCYCCPENAPLQICRGNSKGVPQKEIP